MYTNGVRSSKPNSRPMPIGSVLVLPAVMKQMMKVTIYRLLLRTFTNFQLQTMSCMPLHTNNTPSMLRTIPQSKPFMPQEILGKISLIHSSR